ncbi:MULTISPECIES: hypothetical protein [Halococcus]|uniref:DUF8215 domain-containing protein n=1 Tax=Halococcus salifodinae DSM 8989 TaxID=1227456 RepID=M0MWY6_9EURY|nr:MULTISPECIES: hypothetical protein [Halococcus]EMA50086.1 hypothetical protein C450_15318 [Halococcus salifodinae DSM 8989]
MSPDSGSDNATERRKAGPRTAEKVGVERWIEGVFFGCAEVAILGLPALFSLLDASANAEVKLAAIVALSTAAIAIGTIRTGWTRLSWPPLTPRLLLARAVVHNLLVLVAAYGGATIDLLSGSALGSAAFAVLVAAGTVWVFPQITAHASTLPSWWKWGP